jgi:tetratricopeptide (TPR) repeat protein
VIHAYHPEEPLPEDEDRLARRYRATLHGKRVLLLMNDAADEELVIRLRPPQSCAMIVTSRKDLAVDDFVSLKVAELTESDAVSYLQRIAPRVGDDAQQVARLCGSLPLALRLAGNALAHQRNLGVGRLIEQLRSRQQGQRFEPVYASLSVSYDELEPELQARWRDLAVFPGTFDKAAAAAVWAMPLAEENDPEDEVEDILGDLMRYAMVDWDDETERYRLQTLARGYADDLLDERTRSIVERRHARHYLQVLREANELYKQGGDCIVQGLEWFAQERINIEAGQAWTARHAAGEARSLCIEYPLAGANLLSLRLGPEDRKAWFEAAIRALPRLGDRTAEADLEGNLGNAQRERGELDEAIGHYEKALRIARRYHNRKSESYWQGRLSHAYIVKARSVEGAKTRDWLLQAIEHCSQALKIDQEAPNRRMEGIHLGDLGNAYLRLREPWQAIGHYEQALIIARDEGDRRGESTVLGHLGRAYAELDMVDQASNHYRQALSIDREIGDRWSEARHSWGLGEVHESMGDLQRAVDLMSVRAVYEREIGHQQAEEHAQRVEEIRQRI